MLFAFHRSFFTPWFSQEGRGIFIPYSFTREMMTTAQPTAHLRVRPSYRSSTTFSRAVPRMLELASSAAHRDQVDDPEAAIATPAHPGLGCLDAAAAVGLHPSKSPMRLWLEKTGRSHLIQRQPGLHALEDAPTLWTRMLEPIVAAHYARTTGRRLRRVNDLVRHRDHPWMSAIVEWEVIKDPHVGLLSYLFAGPLTRELWKDGLPDHVWVQAMHALAVTSKHAIDLAVLVCGEKLQVHRVHRDETVIARLVALEESFWGHVERGEPPSAEGCIDPSVVRRLLCTRAGLGAFAPECSQPSQPW